MAKTAFPDSIPELLVKAKRFSQGLGTFIGELGFEPNTLQEVNDLIASLSDLDQAVQAVRGEMNQRFLPELREARSEVWIFATESRDILKKPLGRQWNLGWAEAGFRTPGSLAIPAGNAQREALVSALAAFLDSHPQHENEPAGITRARARSAAARLASASKAAVEAQDALSIRMQARDLEVRRLRVAIRNLINRLKLVLSKNDRRWSLIDLKAPARSGSSESSPDLEVVTGTGQSDTANGEGRLAA